MGKDSSRHTPEASTLLAAHSDPSSPPDSHFELVPLFSEDDYLAAHDRGDLHNFTAAYNPSAAAAPPPTQPFPFQFPLPQIGRITMADRFPKIEDLDLGDEDAGAASGEGSFLDRERAALGEDADLFATAQDQKKTSATVQDGDDDLLGGDDDFGEPQRAAAAAAAAPTNQDDLDFESSFPAIDTQNEGVAPGGKVTGSQEPGGYTGYTAPSYEEEPEPIRQWREKRDGDLARRDAVSEKKKAETVAKARRDIDDYYESYNRKTDKQKAETARQAADFIKNREDTTAGGTSWERIAKLADLSGKGQKGGGEGSTKKKMRELLLDLKGDKNAPGAGGV